MIDDEDEVDLFRDQLKIQADEIERLREALKWIAGCEGGDLFDLWKEMRDTARSALKGDEK